MALLLLLSSALDCFHLLAVLSLCIVLFFFFGGRKIKICCRPSKKGKDSVVQNNNKSSSNSKKKTKDDDETTVKVYILLGQSNMLGMGHISGDKDGTLEYAVKNKGLYQYLVDSDGNWTTSSNVRNVRVMGSGRGKMGVYNNEFLTVCGKTIGPEIGIGHAFDGRDEPVMLLKSCIGNRSLGWDLLPPGSKPFEYTDSRGNDSVYAGYGETPSKCPKGSPPPQPPAAGSTAWYAGVQYDGDIRNAKTVLSELGTYYPGATSCEVAGFFWWQGDKDRYDEGHATVYERNLVRLIKQLRIEFDAPDAKFVLATLGQDELNTAKGNDKLLLDAMLNVSGNAGNYPEFVGNVSTVYSHPLSKGGASNGHYSGNAETYMNIGEAMGKAMVELGENSSNNKSRGTAAASTDDMV